VTYGEFPEPEIGAGDLLVKIRATALNRRDLFAREGSHGVKPPLPYVPGLEMSGEVVRVGQGVTEFKAGDAVLGRCRGSYAELACMAAADAHIKPEWMSFEEAACVTVALATSWHIGINYRDFPEFSKNIQELTGGEGVHVVFEHIGAPVWKECFASLRRGGRFVNSGVTAGHRVELHLGQLWTRELTLMGTTMQPREDMHKIMKLVHAGKLRGVVSQIFPLAEARQAHETMERNEFFGKLVLVP